MIITKTSIIQTLLLLFLIFAALHFGKFFLMPLTIGCILATLFSPFCKWMESKNIPRFFAVFICLLILLLMIIGTSLLVAWQVSAFTNDLAFTKQKSMEVFDRLQEFILHNIGVSIEKQLLIIKSEQTSFTNIMQMMLGSFTYMLTNLFLVLAYLFCILYYRSHIKQFILKLTPSAQQNEMLRLINSAKKVSQQYLVGLAKMIVCLWVMYSIGFSIAGVKNPFFFAIICGLLEIIPYVGNLAGTSLTLFASIMQGANTTMLLGIIITYTTAQLIQGWVLEPMILGPQVKINPFATIIALVVGELVWGIPGIFIAIPVTGMVKIACDHIEHLKPYGFLIGEVQSQKEKTSLFKKFKKNFTIKAKINH